METERIIEYLQDSRANLRDIYNIFATFERDNMMTEQWRECYANMVKELNNIDNKYIKGI